MRSFSYYMLVWSVVLFGSVGSSHSDASEVETQIAEKAVMGLLNQWILLLDHKVVDPRAYELLLSKQTPLSLLEGDSLGVADLETKLRARFLDVQQQRHRIDFFRINGFKDGVYRIEVIVDWQITSLSGMDEIARLQWDWSVQLSSDGKAHILKIHERYLPPLQGMGSRMKC